MAQIEAENLQPAAPLIKIRFASIARSRIPWESRGNDKCRTGPQQFDAGLITDLHSAARQQRHTPAEVRRFGSLHKVELSARRAQLIVEVMNCRIRLLADVTM